MYYLLILSEAMFLRPAGALELQRAQAGVRE